MKKSTLHSTALALVAVAALGLETRAQDAPPAPPAPPGSAVAPSAPPAPAQLAGVSVAPAAPPAVGSVPGRPVLAAAAPHAPASPPTAVAAAAPLPPQEGELAFFFSGDNFLGINAEEVTRENMGRYNLSGDPRGVGVREVIKGSPAERAGIRENDVILRYDGEPVSSIRKLDRLIEESAPEHQARLTIRRGGSEQEVTVTLGKREGGFTVFNDEDWRKQQEEWKKQGEQWKKNGEQWRKQAEEMRKQMEGLRMDGSGTFQVYFGRGRRIGVATENLGKQLADYFGVSHGVLVTSVGENTPASKAGLKAGDIITEADGERVEGAGALTRALNKKEEGDVTLTVVRDRQRRAVRVTPEKGAEPFEFAPGTFAIEAPRATLAPLYNMKIAPMRVAPMRLTIPMPRTNVTPRIKAAPRPLRVRPLTTRRIL